MSRWPSRPRLSREFYKAHGLGNDYLVFEEGSDWLATPEAVARVCRRHDGIGSDGIVALLGGVGRPALRMFNPDGGEFERSGNGLRILASYLARSGRVGREPFSVEVAGDVVTMEVHGTRCGVYDVSVSMGTARLGPAAVGLDDQFMEGGNLISGPGGELLHVVPVSVGNPHLVVFTDDPSENALAAIGPFLTAHPGLDDGANVQLARPRTRNRVSALIWERGVGRTSASGTSACAVAVAAVSEGRVDPGPTSVEMPGGTLLVTVSSEFDVELRGPVEEVMTGGLALEFGGAERE